MKTAIPIAALLLLAGCAGQRPEEAFFSSEPSSLTSRIFDTQAARGARSDGMLCPSHFDGPELNPLGRQKLDLMIQDNSAALPVIVYLDLPDADPALRARTQAVRSYLTQTGLSSSQFRTEAGPNGKALHAARPNLSRLSKTENPTAQGAAAPPQDETPSPAAAAPAKQ
jgi:hypothetical protein